MVKALPVMGSPSVPGTKVMSTAQAALASRHMVYKVKIFLIATKNIKWLIMISSTSIYNWAKLHYFF
jgi:hypothetical protein